MSRINFISLSLVLLLSGAIVPVGAQASCTNFKLLEQKPIMQMGPVRTNKNKDKSGWVDLAFSITEMGMVDNVKVLDSSEKVVFDESAIEALRKWRFRPMIENGKPKELHCNVIRMDF